MNNPLGKEYTEGETIIHQGEIGNRMFVILEGEAEVIMEKEGREIRLAVIKTGEFFGEMAIFEKEVRMATVRALGAGRTRILTVDKKNFLRRIHEDPSLAYRVVETMSHRVRELSEEVARLKLDIL